MMILALESSWSLIVVAFALGVIFAVAEVFLPSGGVLTLLSVASFIAAVVAGFTMGRTEGIVTLAIVVILAPTTLYVTLRIWPHTPIAKRIILAGPSSTGKAGDLVDLDPAELVGKVGVAKTLLRPSGKMVLGDRKIDCVTEGDLVQAGRKVEILEVHGARVVVRAVEEDAKA